MVAELGHYALVLALLVSLVQSSVPLVGAARGDAGMMAVAGPAAQALLALLAFSFLALMHAFVNSDFSVLAVALHSHSAKPLIYKIAGTWGNHEGSMLLWVLILALFGGLVARYGANLPPSLKSRALAVQGMLAAGFLLFILFTSNPFARVLPPPPDGNGLNPLLQDPALAIHPPMLYVGYVGLSICFSFAIAALLEGRVDPAWARWVRPWTLTAWLFLTGGIALGSWWAYYELGWGGWWYWDPVENASFMPWLVATALLHSAIVVEKRDTLKGWTILLAILAFALSLIGTFLVRSGVLTSVHAFAVDPARGVFILALLVVSIGGALALYAWRVPDLKGGGLFAPISREGGLVLNNLLLATATATVFIGTLYPLLLDAVTGQSVSVGPPYYNATFVPLMVPLLIVMGVGPLLAWKRADLRGITGRLLTAGAATLVVAVWVGSLPLNRHAEAYDLATLAGFAGTLRLPAAALGMALAAWLVLGALGEWARRVGLFRLRPDESWQRARGLPLAAHGMTVAHLGVAIAVAGFVGAGLWKHEVGRVLKPGESLTVERWQIVLAKLEDETGPNYKARRAVFVVTEDGGAPFLMAPEKRIYDTQGQPTTEAAIRTTGLTNLYLVLGDEAGGGAWAVRVLVEPMVPVMYYGIMVMMAGGLMSLLDRRSRVGAPRRARAAPVAGGPAAAPAHGDD
ncbi:MAG: heme lyase CcmF/NrfE family subunit [Alphaproteobacteria bacterium]|nr:heme lyase CcmF/NrfE family subunit [Alphaproteobacteria bacterium]